MVSLGSADEFICFGDASSLARWGEPLPGMRFIEVGLDEPPTQAASISSRRSVRDMLRLTRAVRQARPDVFFAPTVYSYFPLPPGTRAVVTIHDTIPERFPHLTVPTVPARLFWTLKVKLALWQCRMVLTVSEHAARSINAIMGVPMSRIRVTTEAPAPGYQPTPPAAHTAAAARQGIPAGAPWFAYVGGFNPHKRVDAIIRAHASLVRTIDPPPHLVLIGARTDAFHDDAGRLEDLVREAATTAQVHWTGYLPDEEVVPLLGGARALLLPSEAEGFGLPAVEAAACGTPVIATRESPLPELLEGAGIFIPPGDETALEAGMRALLDPIAHDRLAARALERVATMSWESSARRALDAIYEAAA